MLHSVLRSPRFAISLLAVCALWVAAANAQDAGLALSTSGGYNTQRLSLKLTAEQAKEAALLGAELQLCNAVHGGAVARRCFDPGASTGAWAPPPLTIAHQLIKAWAEE